MNARDLAATVREPLDSLIAFVENEAPAEWDGGDLGYTIGGLFEMCCEAKHALAALEKQAADAQAERDEARRYMVALREMERDHYRRAVRAEEALRQASVPLGRIGSSEPFSAQEYRRLGIEAREIVRGALAAAGADTEGSRAKT